MPRPLLATLFAAATIAIGTVAAAPAVGFWTGARGDQPAVGGYDAVAYFSGAPAIGLDSYSFGYRGARFRFASLANLVAFQADPERYVPQFGGHCAWAASQGRIAIPDPTIWHVVGNKLYLNCSKDADAKWLADVPGNIARGEAFWANRGR